MIVKPVNKDDSRSAASLRSQLFKNSISTKFGKGYLTSVFEMYRLSDDFIIFIVKDNDVCVGYIVGQFSKRAITGLGSISTTIKYTFWNGVFAVFLRPWLIPEVFLKFKILNKIKIIIKSFFINKQSSKNKNLNDNKKLLVLIDFGVHPEFRKKLIGFRLFSQVESFAIQNNISSLEASIIKENPVKKMYEYLKWDIIEKSDCFVMQKNLTKNANK